MATNYGLAGVNHRIRLGKTGSYLLSDGDGLQAIGTDGTNFTQLSIKDATANAHAVTKKQLDDATASLASNDFITITGTPGTFAATINVPANAKIISTKIIVTTPYNGTEPLLQIGTSATRSDSIDDGTMSDLAITESFDIPIGSFIAGEGTPIICTLSGTGTTTGAATVYVEWAKDN